MRFVNVPLFVQQRAGVQFGVQPPQLTVAVAHRQFDDIRCAELFNITRRDLKRTGSPGDGAAKLNCFPRVAPQRPRGQQGYVSAVRATGRETVPQTIDEIRERAGQISYDSE